MPFPQVQVLSQTLINKIAAGEVIVRPASVVKELVENSFDAGARHIRVEVSKDNRSITVQDDGCGMDEENAKRSVLRHSTSKIRDFEDLERLLTRGFRGEAIASIISVSRFEMLTRPEEALSGVRLVAAGGKVERFEPAGAAQGTTIHVRDLFYNTPARLKFLKSQAAEFTAIVELLTQQALTHPDVALACLKEGQARFDLPAGQSLKQRIEELLGSQVQGLLLPVQYEREGFGVEGFIARPEAARRDRKWQFFMVNGRPIGARQLTHPVTEAYQGLLMKQRFPVVVLDLKMDPGEVDINVHPTKEEVRFEEERKVSGLLYRAVSQTLQENRITPELDVAEVSEAAPVFPSHEKEAFQSAPLARHFQEPQSAPSPKTHKQDPSLPFVFSPKGLQPFRAPSPPQNQPDLFPRARDFQSTRGEEEGFVKPQQLDPENLPLPLGQIDHSYIVAAWGADLLLVDQHAAHERILYKRICSRERDRVPAQPLMLPITFSLSAAERERLRELQPGLEEMGIAVEIVEEEVQVTSLPADFDSIDPAKLIQDMLQEMDQAEGAPKGIEALRDRMRIRLSCLGAIKAGQPLNPDQMTALLRDIAVEEIPFHCPHGRPIMKALRKDQLDRLFGRK